MEKITMLGTSNSGKTCFIYAMYTPVRDKK